MKRLFVRKILESENSLGGPAPLSALKPKLVHHFEEECPSCSWQRLLASSAQEHRCLAGQQQVYSLTEKLLCSAVMG
jgi:hypothetical protein